MSDWSAFVDERLLARCEAHVARGQRLVRDWSLPLRLRPPRALLDPADWRTGYLRVEREYDLPAQLSSDLNTLMPQALLRDLYRPVHEIGWIERPLIEGTGDRGGFAALADARAARKPPERPRLEPALRTMRAFATWRRALSDERWQPLTPDDAR